MSGAHAQIGLPVPGQHGANDGAASTPEMHRLTVLKQEVPRQGVSRAHAF